MKRILRKTAPFLQIPYDAQLQMKQLRSTNALKNFGSLMRKSNSYSSEFLLTLNQNKGVPCVIDPIQGSPVIEGYRNKCGASVGFDREGNVTVGHILKFANFDNNYKKEVVFPDLCDQLDKKHHILIIQLFEKFIKEKSNFTQRKYKNYKVWSGIMVRTNRKNETMIQIKSLGSHLSSDSRFEIKQELLEKFLPMMMNENINVRSFYLCMSSFVDSILDRIYQNQLIFGEKHITESVCQKLFYISPLSFFQINTDVAELMYQSTKDIIVKYINGSNKKVLILDLCCGTGTLGIILSDIAHKVIGVDVTQSSVDDAKYNASVNNVKNIEHFCQDVELFIEDFMKSEKVKLYDNIIAVVNPSRIGLSTKFCETLRKFESLTMILYLSCKFEGEPTSNIFTFCKVNECSSFGRPFKLIKAVPFDPFPHTSYVELLLQLTR